MLIKKIKQYKRIIGEAITITKYNNDHLNYIKDIINSIQSQHHVLQDQVNYMMKNQLNFIQDQINYMKGQFIFIQDQNILLNEKLDFKYNNILEECKKLDLQIQAQNEIAYTNFKAFAEYKNINTGKEIAILGAGPTLKQYKALENVIHIGVNRVCKQQKIKLDYYFIQDFLNSDLYKKEIEKLQCKKFFGLLAAAPDNFIEPPESFCNEINATRYFHGNFLGNILTNRIYLDIRFHPVMDFYSVIFSALHFALYTNPKKIYLIGCDTSFNGYFTSEAQKATEDEMRCYLFGQIIGYHKFKEFAKKWYPETEIISINPVNLKGLFKDIYTDEDGEIIEIHDNLTPNEEMDFSDEAIKIFVDKHIEQVINGNTQ